MHASDTGAIFSGKWRNSLRILIFISAVAALLAGGGILFHHVSRNPVRVSIEEETPNSAPEIAPEKTRKDTAVEPSAPGAAAKQKDAAEPNRTNLRSKQIETAAASVASARQHERKNDLTRAQADFREGLRIDPQAKAAVDGLNRIRQPISEKRFKQQMSAGMAALHNGKYYAAQDAFIKAKTIKPDSVEVKDALDQVDAAVRLKLINDLHDEAATAEQSEDWKMALDSYLAVLKIDGTLQFALQGKARSLDRYRMDRRLQYYLEKPDVLESDQFLKRATDLVEKAEAVAPKGPRLLSQIDKLRQRIALAQTPVRIVLESDTLTDVAVFKVRRLGKFKAKEITLRPGTYTVTGVREGYKDVRQTVVVTAQNRSLHITVKCEEQI